MRKNRMRLSRFKNVPDMVGEIRIPNGWPSEEIWFQHEARFGQKNKTTRRWARRRTRPRALHDQPTKWAYIFGAICPAEGKGAGQVMFWVNLHAMDAQLKRINDEVAPRHAPHPDL